MRFNCGPKLSAEQELAEWRKEISTWKPKFAWWPVRVGPSDCRWLECVEWRGEYRRVSDFYERLGFWMPLLVSDADYWYVKEYRAIDSGNSGLGQAIPAM